MRELQRESFFTEGFCFTELSQRYARIPLTSQTMNLPFLWIGKTIFCQTWRFCK